MTENETTEEPAGGVTLESGATGSGDVPPEESPALVPRERVRLIFTPPEKETVMPDDKRPEDEPAPDDVPADDVPPPADAPGES